MEPSHRPVAPETSYRSRVRCGFFSTLSRAQATYLILFVVACLPYLNTLANGFVYDDVDQILYNPFVLSTRYLKQLFLAPVWAFKAHTSIASYFRPMMSLTFLALHKLYGFAAVGYHIFSVVLAGCLACLVYALTNRWTKNHRLSLVAAITFALHPVHSEAIAWIADVTDLEVSLFIFLAFWCYLKLDESRPNPWLRSCIAAFFLGLALLSKEIAVVLPPLILVFEHFYRNDRARTALSTKVARYAPLWVVLCLYFVYRRMVLGGFAAISQGRHLSLVETLAAASQLFAKYLGKLFWPYRLQAFYVYDPPSHFWDAWVLFGLAAFLALCVLALVLRRKLPVLSFAVLWYIAFLTLALNVRWLAKAAFAERYLFLPSLAFAWVFAASAVALWDRSTGRRAMLRPLLAAGAGILAILAFARIYTRNHDWHDNLTLYEQTLRQAPNAVYMRVNLGGAYWAKGDHERAIEEWQRAQQDDPRFYLPLVNLGMAATDRADFQSADQYFRRAAQLSPAASSTYLGWGLLREKQGNLEDAEKKLLHAVELAPYDTSPHAELGRLYLKLGRLREAAEQLRLSADLMVDPLPWNELGNVYLRLGKVDDAEHAYRSALEANRYDSEAHVGLGQVYERRGETLKALKEYQLGLKDNPRNPVALAGLARIKTSPSR